MKIKLAVLVILSSLFIAFKWQGQTYKLSDFDDKESLLMEVVYQSLQYNHYAPENLDDKFSAKVFDLYIKRLDVGKRFFLKEDMEAFLSYRNQLDDEIQNKSFAFFNLVSERFEKRYSKVKSIYEEILSQPFEFDTEEQIETDGEKMDYVSTDSELKERWRLYLKWQVLSRVEEIVSQQEKRSKKDAKDTIAEENIEPKSMIQIEKEEREKVLKNFRNWSKSIEKETRSEKMAAYVNTFTNAYEPHSGYFPPLEKENFNIRMSGKLEGIGAQLREEDGYIKVVNIVPGSASYRQGELEVNDKIIKVGQGKEEPVDVVDMRIDDVLPLIRGKKDTEVRLTVKKTSGAIKVIPILRDVVVLEESYAKSAILEHSKLNVRVGLIDLRSFYADFDDPNGRRCAKDIKKEVEKLIKEKVDGIVIDLRFNGGGSLTDVVDMTGLFVDKGPIVQVKNRNAKPYVYEDRDPSTLYSGPLIIMVNAYSASASEIMAAALQDHGRAIIVGTSPATFGKGTVQRFFSLDAIVPDHLKYLGELGSIKITIQKFYRINGGSTQMKGVIPDIILPGAYSYMKVGEQEEDYPMAWSEIEPVAYSKNDQFAKIIDKVKKKSAKRVAHSKVFQLIDENAKWLKKRQDESTFSLQFDQYIKNQKQIDAEMEGFKEITKENEILSIKSLKIDSDQIGSDTLKLNVMKNWHKSLKQDAYLEEVTEMIYDWKK